MRQLWCYHYGHYNDQAQSGDTPIQLSSAFRGALLVPGFRRAICDCAIHIVSTYKILVIGVCHRFADAPIDRCLPRVERTRHVGYERFAQLIDIGSDSWCLSAVDAQAPFAELCKICGGALGNPPVLTDERG